MLENPAEAPSVPVNPRAPVMEYNHVVLARTFEREKGIRKAVKLLGGMKNLLEGVEGNVVIKPNCNSDDPYPMDTDPETVRVLAELLIEEGQPPGNIIVGDMSGRRRGLPTQRTMENLGYNALVEDLGIQLRYFEEEPWVTVNPSAESWPTGIRIPRCVHEADRVILAPVLKPHRESVFTASLKLGVGLLDAVGREWLHDGHDFMQKLVEVNMAYPVDMIVVDAMKMNTGRTSYAQEVDSGIIIAGGNRVSVDAVGMALMKMNWVKGVSDYKVREFSKFKIAQELGLGSPNYGDMKMMRINMTYDDGFQDVFKAIVQELGGILI